METPFYTPEQNPRKYDTPRLMSCSSPYLVSLRKLPLMEPMQDMATEIEINHRPYRGIRRPAYVCNNNNRTCHRERECDDEFN